MREIRGDWLLSSGSAANLGGAGAGARVCERGCCPAQPTGVPHLAAESDWPLAINAGDTTLTLYQPQLDSSDGCKLSARITVRADAGKDKLQAQFGVLTVNGRHGRRWRGVRAAGPVNTGDIYSHSGVIGRRLQRVDRQRVGEPGRGFVQLT